MAEYQISARLTLKDQLTSQLKAAAGAAEKLTRGVGDAKKSQIRLDVQGLEKLKRLQDMLRQGGMTQPKPINIRVNDSGASSKISKIRSDITSLAGRAWNVAVNIKTNGMAALNRAKGTISEMATGAAMGMGAGMLGVAGVGFGAVNMVDTYKTFEYQMKRNKALFTTGMDAAQAEQEYQNLVKAARLYGSTMKFTASEVGKAEEYMALAGWTSQQAISALPAVLNAAVASGEDLALVSDIITDDMTAMGYKAGDIIQNAMGENVEAAQHFADVMLRTTLRSNTNFQQLGLAMKYAAPLAHTLGYKIEEVAVAMGLMANNGIKADQAGTGLRGILNRFINEPKKAAESMDKLGVSLFDAQGNAKGLMTTLMDVRAALKGKDVDSMIDFVEEMTGEQVENRRELTDFLKEAKARGGGKISAQDQAKLGSMLSGTYAMAAFMAIMNSTDEDIQKLMTEIYQKSDGTGADIAKQMADTLQGDLDTIKSAWEDFNVELMSGAGANGLRSFIQALTKDINQFKTSLKDGLDFGDIASLGVTALKQLKDKFLELDGIGSLLAGGALFMAMKKILSMGLKIKDTLSAWSKVRTMGDLGGILRGGQGGVIGTSQVGTMHVNAGVVNLMGAARGGVPPATGQRGGVITTGTATGRPATTGGITAAGGLATAGAATAGSILVSSRGGRNVSTYNPAMRQQEIAARNSAYVNDYYARRASFVPPAIPPTTSPIPPATSTGVIGTLKASSGAMAGAGILSLLFGAMDIYSTKSHSEQTSREAAETLAYHKNVLAGLQEQHASQDAIAAQMKEVQDAEAFVDRTKIMNANMERQAELGAAGMVTGTMLGTALGSFVPVIGNLFGGMLGGILGQWAGTKLAEHENARQEQMRQNGGVPAQGGESQNRNVPTNTSGMGVGVGESNNREIQNAWRQHEENMKNQRGGGSGTFGTNEKPATFTGTSTSSIERPEGMDELTWGQIKRRQADIDENNPYFQMQQRARTKALVHQREEYNKRWQEQFGGTSLAGQANFVPDNEYDRKLLADYDREQAYKKIGGDKLFADKLSQQKRLESFKPYGGAGGTFGDNKPLVDKAVADHKANLDKLAGVTNAWHQQQKETLSEIENQKKLAETAKSASQENKGLLGMLDDLIFSKAAASAITSDTNTTPSTVPPQELPTAAIKRETIEPPKPEGGFFDFSNFKLPNFSEIFSGIELPDLSGFLDKLPNIGDLFGNVELPDLSGFLDKLPNLSDLFSNIELPNFSEIFSGLSGFLDKLPNLSDLFSNIELPNFSEIFNFDFEIPDLGAKISGLFENVEIPDLGAKFGEIFSGIELPELGISEKISTEFEGTGFVFETFSASVMTTFSGLAGNIGGALSGVGTAITTVFQSAAGEVQGIWGAMPGFFSGVFSGLGGAASAAGGAIASGLTGVIGGIIGAWQSAAATISGIISSIASAAANAAASAGSFFGGIGSNATGTASWEGGWTEINEHGGEIINLPKGTQIIPHATTVNILKREIRNKIDSGATDFHGLQFNDYGLSNNFATSNSSTSNFENNILGGDIIYPKQRRKPDNKKVRLGQRWNMKPTGGIFGDLLTGKFGSWGNLFGRLFGKILLDKVGGNSENKKNISLGGDIDIGDLQRRGRVKTGQRWNMKPKGGILGRIFDGGFGGNLAGGFGSANGETLNFPPIMNFGGSDSDFPAIAPSQNFGNSSDLDLRLDDKFDFSVPKQDMPKVAESTSNSTNNSNTINLGGVTIHNGADLEEFLFKLNQLINHSAANSASV